MNETETRFRALIAGIAHKPAESISLDARWREIGLDSLDLFEVLTACEAEFGVTIPDSQAIHFHRPADVLSYLQGIGIRE
jgi:acyl carrier protein